MRWCLVCALTAVACGGGRPERPDPTDFSSAATDTGVAPQPNDCDTRSFPWRVGLDGYITGELQGFGTYEYQAIPDQRTSIYLQACPQRTKRAFALHFYGITRMEAGTYNVTRIAREAGGFTFSYTDNETDAEVNCSDLPAGSVTIDSIDFDQVHGSFDVTARCISDAVLGQIPKDAHFVGEFAAKNVGLE